MTPALTKGEQGMNRYQWNRSLIEPFGYMSRTGIRYDAAEAASMRSTLLPQVWTKQAAVDALCGVALPDSTTGLLEAAAAQCCHKVKLRTALKGKTVRVAALNPDGSPRCNKKGKPLTEKLEICGRALSWALALETANANQHEVLARVRDLAEGPQSDASRAELASLLGLSVNVESPDQVIELLDRLGLPAKWKRGARDADDPDAGRTGDEEALLELFLSTGHPITKALLEARSVRGALSWLDTTLPSADGRIRCSISNPGSETGRVLTRQWHDRTGGNLQATSAAPFNFRRLLAADPGHLMAQCDLKSADAWTVAARCAQLGDPTMLRDMQAGVRIPSLIALIMAGERIPTDHAELAKLCKTVKRDWRDYAFKKGTYLSFYMGSASLIRRETVRESWSETGTPIDPGLAFCKEVQEHVLRRYWGLKNWWADCERQVRRTGTLEGASGQVREFLSRRWAGEGASKRLDHSCHKEVVATEPQMVTTYATNLALWHLWTDPENWPPAGQAEVRPDLRCPAVQPLLHVHDALLTQFPEYLLAWAGAKLTGWFSNPIRIGNLSITIPVECGWGPNWGECKQLFPSASA